MQASLLGQVAYQNALESNISDSLRILELQNQIKSHKIKITCFVIVQAICTVTLRNLTEHRKLPEPHKVSAPEPSRTSQGICTGALWSRTEPSGASPEPSGRYLHQNPPEPCPEPGVEAAPDRIGANLGFKGPIAKFCCWGKIMRVPSSKHTRCPLKIFFV